eukprot:1437612-Alexandrium_andersonii.AAC.1
MHGTTPHQQGNVSSDLGTARERRRPGGSCNRTTGHGLNCSSKAWFAGTLSPSVQIVSAAAVRTHWAARTH